MKNDNLIIGLDIGSSKIRTVICEINSVGEINLRKMGSSVSTGITKGLINDPNQLSKAIERSISRANCNLSSKPSSIITNIPLHKTKSIQNMGFVLSKEQSGQISEYEKIECIRRSKNIIKSPDQRVLHVVPLFFKIDGNQIHNPIGAFGNNLEVQTHIILGNTENISNLNYAIKELQFHICGIVYDILANAQVSLTEDERKKGAILIDMGSRFTKVGIFYNNLLYNSFVIPIAGETITSDIAYCLKASIPEAERIKILHGKNNETAEVADKFIISTKDNTRQEIEKKFLCRIIDARIQELFNIIKEKIDLPNKADYQVVLTGGTAALSSTEKICGSIFNHPIRTGLPESIKSSIPNQEYSSAIGLVIYGLKTGAIAFPPPKKKSFLHKMFNKLIKIF
ncbi:cell division protein FtsA [Candidatus Margulisiibacteriota bacterium]